MIKKRIACICLAVATLSALSFTACKEERYDWTKVDEWMNTAGVENNAYYADGSLAQMGKKIDIYYNKDEKAETIVRLEKWYRDSVDDYYSLRFNKHYYDLVENYIVTAQYTCSFHYADDVVYNLELADINVFKGKEEKFDDLYNYSSYQVENKKMENGAFVSCDFTEISVLGSKTLEEAFVLPDSDEKYLNELMTFGFEKTTQYLNENGLTLFY